MGCHGLLADEITELALRIWTIDGVAGVARLGGDSELGSRIRIPIRPFCGEMGVARAERGAFATIPPYDTGGNIDTRHVVAGSTLFLPVKVDGALFSVGVRHVMTVTRN